MKKVQTPSQKQLDKLLQEAQEAMNELPLDGIDNLRTAYKTFVLDYSRIKTVEDVVEVLKALDPEFQWFTNEMPTSFEKLHWNGFLIEKEDDKV